MFLSYINKRTKLRSKLLTTTEYPILGLHLEHNLSLPDDIALANLHDDYSITVDIPMLVRRNNAKGQKNPPGILHWFRTGVIGRLFSQLEFQQNNDYIDLGLLLLNLPKTLIDNLSYQLIQVTTAVIKDRKPRNIYMVIDDDNSIAINCHSENLTSEQKNSFIYECEVKKYNQKVNCIFAISINPELMINFIFRRAYSWQYSNKLEESKKYILSKYANKKINRNSRCPCGSGKKYKKCCINLNN